MARTLAALKTFKQVMAAQGEVSGPWAPRPCARPATGKLFLDQVRDSLGLAVEVLAPEAEARLSLTGVLTALAPAVLAAPGGAGL